MDRLRELLLLLLCLSAGAELLNNDIVEQTKARSEFIEQRLSRAERVKLDQFQHLLTQLFTEIRDLTSKVRDQEEKILQLQTENRVERVAFTAALDEPVPPVSALTTLAYKRVYTNIGNAYDRNTGKFTAPLRGVYHFEFHCYSRQGRWPTAVILQKNGMDIVSAHEESRGNDDHYGTAGNSVSLQLEAGDQVYLHLWYLTTIYDGSFYGSTFSGRLLFPV